MLRNIIQNKSNAMKTGSSRVDDLLNLFLQSNNQCNLPSNVSGNMKIDEMTIEEEIEECKQFYLAGQETTSSWLVWTMIVLAIHPD